MAFTIEDKNTYSSTSSLNGNLISYQNTDDSANSLINTYVDKLLFITNESEITGYNALKVGILNNRGGRLVISNPYFTGASTFSDGTSYEILAAINEDSGNPVYGDWVFFVLNEDGEGVGNLYVGDSKTTFATYPIDLWTTETIPAEDMSQSRPASMFPFTNEKPNIHNYMWGYLTSVWGTITDTWGSLGLEMMTKQTKPAEGFEPEAISAD